MANEDQAQELQYPIALTAYQLLALMSAKFLTSFFGDW